MSTHRLDGGLSFVVLMFNEQESIAAAIDDIVDYADKALESWEIVVVDDGSSDDSAEIVAQIARDNANIRLVKHSVNRGMGAGMATGIANAQLQTFIFFPADRQIAVSELDKMLPLLTDGDIVTTVYDNRRELARRIVSKGMRGLMRITAGIRFRLEGLYLFPTALGRELAAHVQADTFFFSFELIQRAAEHGASIVETQIHCRPREEGDSKVFNLSRIRRVGTEVLGYAVRKRAR